MGKLIQRLPDLYKVGENRRLMEAIEPHYEAIESRIDRMSSYWDPDTAPAERLDAMLYLLGWRANIILTERQKRKLVKMVNTIHHLSGTSIGIVKALRFLLGIDVEIREYLKIKYEADGSSFPDGDEKNVTFDVVFPIELRQDDIALAKEIVVYMMDPTTIYRPIQMIAISNTNKIIHSVTMSVSVKHSRNVYDPKGIEYKSALNLDGSWALDGRHYMHGRKELPSDRKSEARSGSLRLTMKDSSGKTVRQVNL